MPCSLGSTTDVGRWDVDNDSDGVCDSIWVDLGAEVLTARDGRKYKPLFAPLVIDMDGKFNLNAQGKFGRRWTSQLARLADPIPVRRHKV